jgi:hypothetical protein
MSLSISNNHELNQEKNQLNKTIMPELSCGVNELSKAREIFCTKEYHLFKPYYLQRELQQKNLASLREAIERHNLLSQHPIHVIRSHPDIVDEEHPYLITSGNHRFTIGKEKELEVYFMDISDDFQNNDLIDTGHCLSKWAVPQFLQYYVKLGKEDYIKFDKFRTDLGLDIHTALPLTTEFSKRSRLSDAFRRGEFRFIDEDVRRKEITLGKEFLNILVLYGVANKGFLNNSAFFDGYIKLMKRSDYNQKKLMDRVIAGGKKGKFKLSNFAHRHQFYEWFKTELLMVNPEEEL